jgi:hypothetical protein
LSLQPFLNIATAGDRLELAAAGRALPPMPMRLSMKGIGLQGQAGQSFRIYMRETL